MANLSAVTNPWTDAAPTGWTKASGGTGAQPTSSGGTLTCAAGAGYGYSRMTSTDRHTWDVDQWISVPITALGSTATGYASMEFNPASGTVFGIWYEADGDVVATINGSGVSTVAVGTTVPRYLGMRRNSTGDAVSWGHSTDRVTWTTTFSSSSWLPDTGADIYALTLSQESAGTTTFAPPNTTLSSADTTAPVVASAVVAAAGTSIDVTYTETGSPPILPASAVTGWSFGASGGAVSITDGARVSNLVHRFTLSRTILSGETVTRGYAPGNVTDSAATPNALASFSAQAVTNNSTQTADTTAPVVASAEVLPDGVTVRVTYTEAGSPPVLPASAVTGWTFKVNTVARTISSSTRSSANVHDFTLASAVLAGETVTRSYSAGNVTDSAATPNALAAFTDQPVTNSVTSGSLLLTILRAGDLAMQDVYKGGVAARRRIQFYAVNSSGAAVTALTGTPTLSINGAAPSATGSNAAREIGSGYYDVEVTDANIAAGDSVRVAVFSTASAVVGGLARVVAVDVAATPPPVPAATDNAAAVRTNLATELGRIDASVSGVPAAVRTNLATELARIDSTVSSSKGLTTAEAAKVDALVADMLEVLKQTVQTGAETAYSATSSARTVVRSNGTALGTLTYTRNAQGRVTGIAFTGV